MNSLRILLLAGAAGTSLLASAEPVFYATPTNLAEVARRATHRGEGRAGREKSVDIRLAPGVYDLAKIFPNTRLSGAKDPIYFWIAMSEIKSIWLTGGTSNAADTVFLGGGTNSDAHAFGAWGGIHVANITFRSFHTTCGTSVFWNQGGHSRYHVTNCVFEDCSTEGSGGAGCDGAYRACVFRNCRAARNGGAVAGSYRSSFADCLFENCFAGGNGGALDLWGEYVSGPGLTNCTFRGNVALNGSGGAVNVRADARGPARIVNCRFEGNVAAVHMPATARGTQLASDAFPARGGATVESGNTFGPEGRIPYGDESEKSFWQRLTGRAYVDSITVRPGDDLVAVRDRLRRVRKPGGRAEVVFEDGVYRLDGALVLNERDANTSWRAKHNGKATIVGGWNFRGRDAAPLAESSLLKRLPAPSREKVRAIAVPDEVRAAFATGRFLGGPTACMGYQGCYNGKRAKTFGWMGSLPTHPVFSVDLKWMQLAQWPNGDDYMYGTEKDGTVARASDNADPALVRVESNRCDRWLFDTTNVYAIGFLRGIEYCTLRARVKKDAKPGHVLIGSPVHRWIMVRFVNVLEELDTPGEWFFDGRTGLLVFYPPEGFNADSLCAVGTTQDHFFHVLGSGIDIDGFNFTAKIAHPAVCVEGGERVRIRGCRFSGLEYWACFLSGRHNEIRSCDVCDIPADGFYVCGGDPRTLEYGDNLIENCHASHFGFMRSSWARGGFYLTGCGNRLRHSQADNSQEVGFEYDGVDNVVEYCRTHTVSFWWGDSGAVYTQGGMSVSYGNVFRFNDISGSPDYVNGLYMDDCCSGHTVYGNVVRNFGCGGIFVGGGRDNHIYNNLVISPRGSSKKGFHLDLRGLAWPQCKSPQAVTNNIRAVRAMWDPETSPVAKKYPKLAGWFDDPERMQAPYDDHWHDNVIVDCNIAAGVGTGAELLKPEFRLKSERNLHIRTCGGKDKDCLWELGGFKTIDGATNAPLDIGVVDLPRPELSANARRYTWRKGDFTLRDDSIILRENPNFKPIPFSEIGLYADEWRTRLPE